MKRLTIRITEAQFDHFASFAEREGCKSVSDMFRKAGFLRWPMTKSGVTKASIGAILTTQESFPHTPFKEYNNNKNISIACAREEKPKKPKSAEPKFVPPTLDEVREYIAAKGYTFDAEHF